MASVSAAAASRRAADSPDVWARIAQLEARVAQLEATPPSDAADVALRRQLATSTAGRCFTASELLKHAEKIGGALRAALLAARLQGSHEVGSWLRDQRGTSGGITITRVRGRRWFCSTCDT